MEPELPLDTTFLVFKECIDDPLNESSQVFKGGVRCKSASVPSAGQWFKGVRGVNASLSALLQSSFLQAHNY